MVKEIEDSVLDRLIQALAAQVGDAATGLSPGAAEALAGLSRAEANVIFSHAGHLVHYGTDTEPVEALIELIAEIQRTEVDDDDAIVPGDRVRLVGDLPPTLAKYNEMLLRETVFVVRYVGDDGTIDVQPELVQDYVVETVSSAIVKPAQ